MAARNSTHPRRIASLLAGATEMLYSLGLGERVVAVSHECDYPPEIAGKPRVTQSHIDDRLSPGEIDAIVRNVSATGSSLYRIDAQALGRLAPDLIVTQAQCDVCAIRHDDVVAAVRCTPGLQHAHIFALNPNTLEDVFEDMCRLAQAAGAIERGYECIAALRRRVDAVAHRARLCLAERQPCAGGTGTESAAPKVACIEWTDPIMISANWVPDLVRLAGGRCELAAPGTHSRIVSAESIREWDPDVMIVVPCGFTLARAAADGRALVERHDWQDVGAVRRGRVYAADGNAYFNRSGPRLVDSLELLAALIHPDAFSDFARAFRGLWCNLRQA